MAFTFNWTPLTAPTNSPEFYSHAKELLTTALNSSPNSSAILDSDIVVENLNLGKNAPEIEVLEIGDLADDKFRGVFRINYEGDAFLTLKTRVQINTLNAYLAASTRYTSPDTLAASSPLSIPLQITLSDFKLSGFVILVFSRAKGITLVFRNDPLESLKVQSTFDSIPSIKDYLQEEIESQVRGLFQEDLPVAIYKLSLRGFNPDDAKSLGLDTITSSKDPPYSTGNPESSVDNHFLNPLLIQSENSDSARSFPETNLLRLSALMNSQNTLSLFTPAIPNVLYRAKPPTSILPSQKFDTTSIPSTESSLSLGLHPSLFSSNSSTHLNGNCTSRRKKKHRVVNLRKKKDHVLSNTWLKCDDTATIAPAPELASVTGKKAFAHSSQTLSEGICCQADEFAHINNASLDPANQVIGDTLQPAEDDFELSSRRNKYPPRYNTPSVLEEPSHHAGITTQRPRFINIPRHPSGILEKAFMMKLVSELQKRAEEDHMNYHYAKSKGPMYGEPSQAAVIGLTPAHLS